MNSRTITKAMVLAAGLGTRMGDLTREIPKALLPLDGDRIIDVILRKLEKAGIREVVINLHHKKELILEYLAHYRSTDLQIHFSIEEELLNTGGGIAHAAQYFGEEPILVVNSDVLTDLSLADFFDYYYQHHPLAAMAVLPTQSSRLYNLVEYDDENRLVGFRKKEMSVYSEYRTGIYVGYQILSHRARGYLKPQPQSIIHAFYQPALERREEILVYPFTGKWVDLGTRELYEDFIKALQNKEYRISDFV